VVGEFSFNGSVPVIKRAKYNEDRQKSQCVLGFRGLQRGRSNCGPGDVASGRMMVQRIARLVEGDVLGRPNGSVLVGPPDTTPNAGQWITEIGPDQ